MHLRARPHETLAPANDARPGRTSCVGNPGPHAPFSRAQPSPTRLNLKTIQNLPTCAALRNESDTTLSRPSNLTSSLLAAFFFSRLTSWGVFPRVCLCALRVSKAARLPAWFRGTRTLRRHTGPSHDIQDTRTRMPAPQTGSKEFRWLCSDSLARDSFSLFTSPSRTPFSRSGIFRPGSCDRLQGTRDRAESCRVSPVAA